LDPLEPEPSLELTRNLLRGSTQGDVAIESRVLEQARGNPFFIRLLCSHFLSTKDGNFLRKTITEILDRRLEQLSSEAMRALQACVILGKNCTYARLETLLQLPRHILLSAVEELEDQALVQIDGCVVRRHELLAEVVQSRMSKSVYRAMHMAAATLLQVEWTSARGGSIPWDCAEHWRLAGDDKNAVAALRSCAHLSMEMGRPSDALITLKRALHLNTSDVTRLEIIEDALAALWLGVNWTQSGELIPELKRLRTRLGRPASQHDKAELVELALALHSDGDPRENVERLKQCVKTENSTLGHKLFAARHLIMIAELTVDRELADFAFQSLSDLEPGGYWLVFSQMLYHTVFGDPTVVPGLLERLEPVVELPRLLVVLLNIGYAQYRVGNCTVAESTLLRAIESAQHFEMASAEMHGVLFLARMHWSVGQINQSEKWHRRFTELLARNQDPNVFWEHAVLGARLATVKRNFAEARQYIEIARGCKQTELDLPHLFVLACETDLRIAAGQEPCSDIELEDFLSLHLRARDLGLQDEVTVALLRVLELRGQPERALQLLQRYVTTHRRDGFALHPELLAVASRVGCKQSENAYPFCELGSLANSSL
jgi:tetratricopeptide (TPR) repeat protein